MTKKQENHQVASMSNFKNKEKIKKYKMSNFIKIEDVDECDFCGEEQCQTNFFIKDKEYISTYACVLSSYEQILD